MNWTNKMNEIIELIKKNHELVCDQVLTEHEIKEHLIEIIKILNTEEKCKNNHSETLCGANGYHFRLVKQQNHIYLTTRICPKIANNHDFLMKNNIWYSNLEHNDKSHVLNQNNILVEQEYASRVKLINLLLDIKRNKTKIEGLYLYGNSDIGKTHIISSFCNSLALKNHSIVYLVMNNFIIDIHNSITNDDNKKNEIIEKMIECEVLVFDELGKETYKDHIHNQIIYPILNSRNQSNKLTIFISKYDLKTLAKNYKMQYKNIGDVDQFINRIERIVKKNIYHLTLNNHH